ncbi:hypothetical protein HDV01_003203 [Terramyces sp. JEL0728]|nr:hypothetical protein HDV01_003203 [Terramyces sp. JEL0728]
MEMVSEKTFANSFWGHDDKGWDALLQRMKRSKHVSEEITVLLKERSAIEEEYGKRLAKLAKNFSPKDEIGTLRESLDVIRIELEKTARAHLDLASDLKVKLERPMVEFVASQTSIRKNHQRINERNIQQKSSQETLVTKNKEKYEQKSAEYLQMQQLAKTQPQNEKLRVKLDKLKQTVVFCDQDYEQSCLKLEETHSNWQQDFLAACVDFQKLEQDRFHFIRGTVWNYTNFLSSVCVSNDESCENIRVALEKCNLDFDIQLFIDECATGTEIPRPASYPKHNRMPSEMSSQISSGASLNNSTPQFQFTKVPKLEEIIRQEQEDSRMDSTFQYDPYDTDHIKILFNVRCLYSYESQAKEELSIVKDDVIPVLAKNEDGWWEGLGYENGIRRRGLFPSNFTEPC